MRTVKEVSELTGISVRTLHYYDEIGLFKPTEVTEAGYRLYDDKAIEKLGQILVFRELDLPLADIKLIMDNPDLDRNSVLAKQREMLWLKKQRLERIIANIDNMLKGDHDMDFTVFDETELRAMFSDMLQNMNESQKQIFIDRYGSIEAWEKHMIEGASDEKVQKNYAKVVEWYGSKEAVKESLKNPPKSEVFTAYQKRIGSIQQKLADMKGTDVNSFEVRQLIGEYDFVAKQLYQVEDARPLLMDIAKGYQKNEELAQGVDVGQINYISQELKRVNGRREHLFESFTEGVLDEAEYRFAKHKYDDEAAELGKRLSEARAKRKQLDGVLTLDNKWLSAMREAEDKTEVDSELVKHLIKAVKIYEEKRVEVELNFGEQKKVMERIIGEMMEGDSDE